MRPASPAWCCAATATVLPHTGRGVFTGFLDMPTPAWDLLPLKRYRLPLVNEPYVLIETSRGCPYSCDFCVVPLHHGHTFRERSAKVLVDEIANARRDHGIRFFYLWGDTVTLNAKTFSQFCEELIARNLDIRWLANARADNLVDLEFVKRLKRSGCWMLSMGIESESDAMRKDMMKRLERQKIQMAFKNLREAGIKSFAFFIYGYPGETPESMEQNTRYAIELDADFANFYPAVPYPGTALYERAKREGRLTTDDWTRMEYLVLRAPGRRPQRAGRNGGAQPGATALLPPPQLHRQAPGGHLPDAAHQPGAGLEGRHADAHRRARPAGHGRLRLRVRPGSDANQRLLHLPEFLRGHAAVARARLVALRKPNRVQVA